MPKRFAPWLMGLTASLLAGCATTGGDGTSPITPGYRPEHKGLEANLWYVMDKAERDLKTSPFVIRDPALNRYVRQVTCRVAQNYCKDIRIYIVRTPYFNASMAPNGMMQIWTGLLLRVKNEAQLAAVIGHEFGHYVRQHSLQRFEDLRNKSDFAAFLGLGLAVAGGAPAASLANLVILASIFSYSRDQEREADAFGLDVMAKAGYSPEEAANIWKRLIRERDAAEKKEERDFFFASHPAPEERVETLEKLAKEKRTGDTAFSAFRKRLVAALAPYRPWMLRDQMRLRQYGRTEALMDMLIEDGNGTAPFYFYKGELYRHRAGKGDLEKAMHAYDDAIEAGNPPVAVWRSKGLIHRSRHETDAARAAFRTYLARAPDASDRLMIQSYIGPGESKE